MRLPSASLPSSRTLWHSHFWLCSYDPAPMGDPAPRRTETKVHAGEPAHLWRMILRVANDQQAGAEGSRCYCGVVRTQLPLRVRGGNGGGWPTGSCRDFGCRIRRFCVCGFRVTFAATKEASALTSP